MNHVSEQIGVDPQNTVPQQEMPDFHPFGLSNYTQEEIMPGVNLITMEVNRGEGVQIDFTKPDDIFEFGFVLSGKARTRTPENPESDSLIGPDSVVAHYMPNIQASFEIEGKEAATMLGIDIELSMLKELLKDNEYSLPEFRDIMTKDEGLIFKHQSRMCTLQRVAAQQIMSCPFTGPARNLFVQSKVLELLAYQLDAITVTNKSRRTIAMTPEDVDRIHEAREILKQNMDSPPTLTDLASMIGMNSNKLKKCFRAVFDQTAFGCLHEDRMRRAKALLQERNLNVSEVAWEIGYTNVGHFSVAFRNFFGVRPKDFRADSGKRFHPCS